MRRVALYPGSFDPMTLGHLDIIRRASRLFDELVVLVAESAGKQSLFDLRERVWLAQDCVQDLPGVSVASFQGLTVDYARKIGAQVLIRGLRAVSDFEMEFAMSAMNRKLSPELETLVMFTDPRHSFIASRIVKEVALHGGDLDAMVPQPVRTALERKFQARRET